MKVTLTAAIVFFLVFLNTYAGVKNVDHEQIAVLRLMGASERHITQKVVLPSAITWVFAGLRLSVSYAVSGAVVGEIIAANKGLSYLLQNSAGQFDTAGVFAAIIAIMALALAINIAVKALEVRLMPWRSADTERQVAI
jgi:NitT/TauT family transport system permease protein